MKNIPRQETIHSGDNSLYIDQFRELLGTHFNEKNVQDLIIDTEMKQLGSTGELLRFFREKLEKASTEAEKEELRKKGADDIKVRLGRGT